VNRAPTTYALLAMIGAATGCGTDAQRRYAGLSELARDGAGLRYTLRYQAPPWKRRDTDPLALGTQARVAIGGSTRAYVPGSGSVLEIGTSTVAVVPGENFPKYRIEAALVRCDPTELAGVAHCAQALQTAELRARGSAATSREHDDAELPHHDVVARDAADLRNIRVAFFEAPVTNTALWVYMEAYPSLTEREVEDMLGAISIEASAAVAP